MACHSDDQLCGPDSGGCTHETDDGADGHGRISRGKTSLSGWGLWRLVCGLVLVAGFAPALFADSINLTYDEAGRLVGFSDGAGTTATYNYDALGNIVSIGQAEAGQVSIIEFTPNSGPAGSTVTISGTGFSATPSQNTLTFNGTTAAVSAASSTQLVVQVPVGATTGPIGVVTPNGSAMSSSAFTVSESNAPTITSITPSVGPVGTAVTIAGNHFEAVPSNNKLAFNDRPAVVTSATTSSLATSVGANTTSGKVSVSTPYGKAVSTQDFYVVPAPYTAADIQVADRMAIGDTKTVTISSTGKKALILFDAVAGQRVGLQVNSKSFASCVNIKLTQPDGGTVYSGCMNANSLIDPPPVLQYSGTYTIFINPSSNQTGSITFALPSIPADVTGTITVDGPPVTVTTTGGGQNASLTFSGSAGQRVALQSTNTTYPGSINVSIYKPAADGSASTSNGTIYSSCCWNGNTLTDLLVLPAAGTYTIVLNPPTTLTGSMTLKLFSVPPDATSTIEVDGPSITVTTTVVAQNGVLTFSGSTGQRVALQSTNTTYPGSINVSIYKPAADGSASTSNGTIYSSCCWNGNTLTDLLGLPAAGTYTIVLNPPTALTGSMTLKLFSVPPDATGTITVDGPPVTATTTSPVQNASLTFSGSAGQRVALQSTNTTYPGSINVSIYKPAADGSASTSNGTVYSSCCWGGNTNSGVQTLPTAGSYTIVLNPPGMATGSMTLNLLSQ